MTRASTFLYAITTITVFLIATSPLHAVVSTIDATVWAKVEEYVGSELANSDEAFEDLDNSTGNLPLVVDVGFIHTGPNGEKSGTSATTTFNDPRLSLEPDPNEFGIDVTAYSEDLDTSYASLCNSTETREINFSPTEIGVPVDTEIRVRSHFYVDGLIVVWGKLGQTDLSDTVGEFWLTVKQHRPDDTEDTTVLETAVKLTGRPDGTVNLSATGGLAPANVTLMELGSLITEVGPMHILIVPDTAIPYLYDTKVGEHFSLRAEIEGRINTQPGTGAAVALGVPLLELIDLITDVTGSDVGTVFQDTLQNALSFGPLPLKPLKVDGQETEITIVGKADSSLLSILPIPICGLMGIESVIFLSAFLVLTIAPWRRRY